MEDIRAIYKIPKALDRGLDDDELDQSAIDPEALGVSENHRDAFLAMLADEGDEDIQRNVMEWLSHERYVDYRRHRVSPDQRAEG